MKILLIEDDKDISELYLDILKDNSFDVDHAFEGDSGMEKISKGDFDTVIIDIMLPNKDGLDILKESKKKGFLKNKKVLVLSSIDRSDVLAEVEKLGANKYVVKSSVNPQELVDIINNL
jgi:DNA-binding response OmpR family regulator